MRLTGFAFLLLLGGCAALPPRSPVDAVVAEVLQASRAPVAEQKAALSRAQQAFLAGQTPANRLRLATLLATLPEPLRDDARAAELLEPIADAGEPGVGRFAALVAGQVSERRRLAREAERLAQERERNEKERERSDKERDKREEALRQQLDALRAIERGILEREERLRRRTN